MVIYDWVHYNRFSVILHKSLMLGRPDPLLFLRDGVATPSGRISKLSENLCGCGFPKVSLIQFVHMRSLSLKEND